MLNASNIYIDLLNKIKESGGAVPPELVEEVEALDTIVNGDETTEPPTVGLVDIVADLGDEVEDLDIDINGDDTTEPPTPGLKDRVTELETTINGDSSVSPVIPPLLAGAGNMRIRNLWTNQSPSNSFAAQEITLSSGDYDMALIIFASNGSDAICISGSKIKAVGTRGNYFVTREVQANYGSDPTKCYFWDGYEITSYGNTSGVNSEALIPLAVYGIKIMSN